MSNLVEFRGGESARADAQERANGVNNPLFARLSEYERRQLFHTREEDVKGDDLSEMQWLSSFEIKKAWRKYSSGLFV
ncbi:hypothetical protein PsorP6_015701 [Peronosclerospora sorghi]|uniref:Uncharacterized protein n=1 Tax=Peronosclerospora sorghi TaxID=230839 RepID=A0ACC0WPZ6_9STRA|nr:hypothetical protein PsorP6_015701 [Peronosclerospora sorghi]